MLSVDVWLTEHIKLRKEQELAERKAPPKEKASPSDTQIWKQLKQKVSYFLFIYNHHRTSRPV